MIGRVRPGWAWRRTAVVAGSTVLAGFALMAPAYAAGPAHTGAAHAAAADSPAAASHSARAPVPHTPSGARVESGGPLRHAGASQGGPRNAATSENWSGYAANGGTYTRVSANWVEPSGTCKSGDQYSSFWVGLDGYSSPTVEQTGSEMDCSGSKPQYSSWYEMYPANPVNFRNTVKPGDHFTGSVTYAGGTNFTVKLADTTQGWSHTVTQSVPGALRSSAEVITEAPCCTASGGVLPLADFGTVNFTNSMVDGAAIGNTNPTQIDMVSASGTPEDSVSSLSSGENFSVTWESSGQSRHRGKGHRPASSAGPSNPATPGGRRH